MKQSERSVEKTQKETRKEKKITRDELEEKCCLNDQSIKRIEMHSSKTFDVVALCAVADYFDVDEFHAYDLIKYVVKKLNNSNIKIKNNNKNYSFSLKDVEDEENIDFYINNYEIKPFEILPKKECSNYSSKALLNSIEEENITI